MVFGDDRPAVFFRAFLDLFAARVDHGFNGEGHAFPEHFKRAGFAVMQNLRLFVEDAANAVPAKFAHHAETLCFGKFLDGPAHVTQAGTGFHHLDAVPHGVVSHAAQPLGGNRAVAHDEHAAGVAVPAIFDDGHVDVEGVALFERLVVRNAVAHLVVD